MNFDLLHRYIKPLDLSRPPAISDAELDYFRFYGLNFEEKFDDVEHYFGNFISDRFHIVSHYFKKKSATATCFLLHGYFDHSGLYRHLIEYCLQRNFSVVIFDLPGHGLSTGEQVSISDFSTYQTVLDDWLTLFKQEAPKPWHGIGQSTGGAILAEYLLHHGDRVFDKSVLLAPLLYPRKWLTSSLACYFVKPFVGRIKRKFIKNSGDTDFVEFLERRDHLQSRYLSLQWVTALRKWIARFLVLPHSDYAPLIVQGRNDTTVDWKKNIPIYQQKFPNSKVFYLQSGYHHLAADSVATREKIYAAMDVYFDVCER
jgi:lysophospholipase